MKLHNKAFMGVILAGVLVSAFAVRQILPQNPPEPSNAYFTAVTAPAPVDFDTESSVAIPIRIPISDLAQWANQSAPKKINGRKGNVSFDASRGAIIISGTHSHATFKIPFSGSATYSKWAKVNLILFKVKTRLVRETSEFAGAISGKVKVGLTTHWKPQLEIKLNTKMKKAKLRLFNSFPVSFRSLAEDKINAAASKSVDSVVAKAIDRAGIRSQVERVWTQFHTAIKIQDHPPLYIQLSPEQVSIAPITIDQGFVEAKIALLTKVRGFVGEQPDPIFVKPLPPLKSDPNLSAESVVNFPLSVDLDQLAKALRQNIPKISVDGHSVTLQVKRIQTVPGEGSVRLVASIEAQWSEASLPISGEVVLSGNPVLDVTTQRLKLEKLTYSFEANENLARIAAWVLEPTILSEIQSNAEYDLNAEFRQAVLRIPELIAKASPKIGISIQCEVTTLEATGLEVRDDRILVSVRAKGQIAATPFARPPNPVSLLSEPLPGEAGKAFD